MKTRLDSSAISVISLKLMVWFVFLAINAGYSQSQVTGKITGKDGIALSGATVAVVGTTNVTITDADGKFALAASPGALIEFSYIGYNSFQMVLRDETELNIPLTEGTVVLNEIVVVGYGTARRKDITGAVASVSNDEFIKGNVTNALQQIQGKVAGVVITQPGGDPNGDFIVRVRGATSLEGQPPLLVIDGVAIDDFQRAVTTLNPADIASYDILKDASATAIYGTRGANGVILVTTKKGKSGRATIDYSGFTGIETISNQLNVLSADEWRGAVDATGSGLDKGADVDWQKEASQNAISQSHLIGLSGGTDQLNFRGSVGYLQQDGVIINTGKEVFTARLNVVQKSIQDKLEITYGINTSVIDRNFLHDQFSTNQVRNTGSDFFSNLLSYLPVYPVYDSAGKYYQIANPLYTNPLYQLNDIHSEKRENFFQTSVKANFEVINELKVGILGALSRGNDVYDYFDPGIASRKQQALAAKSNANKQVFTGDIHFNYRKSLGKHTIDITGVYEYNKFLNDGFTVTARGYIVPELLNNNLGLATSIQTNDISSFKNEVRLISFVGRAVYNFDDRFILTANYRRDGSSKFAPAYRWANFPSLALAWRLSNEAFMRNLNWLNLKLRASYGYTGNQENIQAYPYQQLYGPAGPYLYDGQFLQSYAVTQENNPDLKWEVRKSFNVGVDFSLLEDRINGTVDFFSDNTSDMLFQYDLPQPPFLTNQVIANAATAVNTGVEVTLGASILRKGNFTWDARVNVASLRNYVTNLSGHFKGTELSITERHYGYADGRGLSGAYITQLKVGYPAGVFWVPHHAGFDDGGRELFDNYDSFGNLVGTSLTYSDKDRIFINPLPDFTWGVTNNFTYKNFDLSIFFRGVQGQKIFANSLLNLEAKVYLPGGNVTDRALTNEFTEQPKPSDYWIQDGSFARLENVTLGYKFKYLKGINRLRLYLVAKNLLVITNYTGIDPEINTDGSQRYIDRNYYPKTRGLTVGIDLTF